jgi:phosphoribosylamine---glycine ligase
MTEQQQPKERRNRSTTNEGRSSRPNRRRNRNSAGTGEKTNRQSQGNRRRPGARNDGPRNDNARRNRSRRNQPRRRQRPDSSGGKLQVLVLGSGGREHTLVWKLAQSPKVGKIFAYPGSSAIAELAQCVTIKPDNFKQNVKQIAQYASRNHIDLTIVGPEAPLAAGIVDEFKRRNLRIFGPSKAAAELEWSKVFAKQFMRRHNIPTASFKAFSSPNDAITFCRTTNYPLVIKADGLAAGKGVLIVADFSEAVSAIDDLMTRNRFGSAGKRILVEEFISGLEVSIMAFSDGDNCWPMIPSQDHKRIGEGDTGPNTGGMGAYAPATFVTPELMQTIREYVLEPCIKGMATEGRPYKGVIYAGIMLTDSGPKALEFNCRFGDPETQVVLPLLESDIAEIMIRIADHKSSADDTGKDNTKKTGKRGSSQSKKEAKQKESKKAEENPIETGPVYLRDLVDEFDPTDEEHEPDEKAIEPLITWSQSAAASITLAARNYPGKPETGKTIRGLDPKKTDEQPTSVIFHAGTKKRNGGWVTSGGRVLNVTGMGDDVTDALQSAYAAVDKIRFDGMQFRRDIGHQALKTETPVSAE